MAKVTLNLKKLSNKEFSRLVINLLRDWQTAKVTLEDPVLTKLKTRLTQESDLLHQGLYVVNDNSTIKDMEKADQARDLHLQLLADTVKLGRFAQTPEEKAAYNLIKPLFKDVAKVKQKSYEAESSSINGILDQLKKTELQAPVKSLNLAKPIQLLTKSQEDFEALTLKRHTGKPAKIVYNNKLARKNLQETYQILADYLYIMQKELGTVAYKKLYQTLETNATFFKHLTGSRKTKDSEKAPSDQTPPSPKDQEADKPEVSPQNTPAESPAPQETPNT